jgi:hypothetical protein
MLIGGWTFLTMLHSVGAENVNNQWPFQEKGDYFISYNQEMSKATSRYFEPDADLASATRDPHFLGYVFGAVGTMVLAVLRQLFAGFWFHPVGFILGPSWMMLKVWGSVLAAFVIRGIVLKIGGAVTVRTKLLPFFTGVFLAGVTAYIILMAINGYLYYFRPGAERFGMIF